MLTDRPSNEIWVAAALLSKMGVATGLIASTRRSPIKPTVATAATIPRLAPTFLGVSGIEMTVPVQMDVQAKLQALTHQFKRAVGVHSALHHMASQDRDSH